MRDIQSYTERIHQLISKNKLTEAFHEIQQLLKGSPLYDEFILQSARYSDIMKSIRMGTIDFKDANIEKNNVRYALVGMIRELEEGSRKIPSLKEEVESFLQTQSTSNKTELNVIGDENINIQGSSNVQINIPKS